MFAPYLDVGNAAPIPEYLIDRLIRCSLVVRCMYTAQALGLPLLPPSLAKDQSFKQGANFAVAGATALKTSTTSPALYPQLAVAGSVVPPPNNISLADELGWFDAMKPALCGSPQGT